MENAVFVTRSAGVRPEKAWHAIAAIGGLDRWFPVLADCTVEGSGVGTVRRRLGRGTVTLLTSADATPQRAVAERSQRRDPHSARWQAWWARAFQLLYPPLQPACFTFSELEFATKKIAAS